MWKRLLSAGLVGDENGFRNRAGDVVRSRLEATLRPVIMLCAFAESPWTILPG
ncbi:hypothetical protein J2S88_003071 [Agrobacterium tumefaciens]|nr:hypothetical protein [Agrobacterium tumefaciens]MDP9978423.1 hypothetical protein [Agrobacterium tumefaciens]